MSSNSSLRALLDLPGSGPSMSVGWLLFPWAMLAVWAAKLGPLLAITDGSHNSWVEFLSFVALARFQAVTGVAFLVSWAWLYLAWPEHTRVFCWCALVAYLAGFPFAPVSATRALPAYVGALRPALVVVCVIAAIVVQMHSARNRDGQIASRAV